MIDQSEILIRSQVQFITLFFGGAQLCCTFYQPRQAPQILVHKNQTFWRFCNKLYCLVSHTVQRWRCSQWNRHNSKVIPTNTIRWSWWYRQKLIGWSWWYRQKLIGWSWWYRQKLIRWSWWYWPKLIGWSWWYRQKLIGWSWWYRQKLIKQW